MLRRKYTAGKNSYKHVKHTLHLLGTLCIRETLQVFLVQQSKKNVFELLFFRTTKSQSLNTVCRFTKLGLFEWILNSVLSSSFLIFFLYLQRLILRPAILELRIIQTRKLLKEISLYPCNAEQMEHQHLPYDGTKIIYH